MPISRHLEQLNRMHSLIKFHRTGTPEQFAKRMGVSRSQLFKLLSELRTLGAPVYYSQTRQSYAYRRSVELQLGFVPVGSAGAGSHLSGSHRAAVRTLNRAEPKTAIISI